jgi:anti-sigma regulatory factor (Ser/Thr protein kinase)
MSGGAFVVSERFPAVLATPAAARRFVAGALAAAGVPESETVPLAVSELVTNTVLHTGTPSKVVVVVDQRRVRVEVHDGDPTLPTVRAPSPETVTGRGLVLVDALTDRWGCAPGGAGKVVWFEVDL